MHKLNEMLKHSGIKGMRWGIRRNRNRPGGADGKEESGKVSDNRTVLKKKLDSMKRERQWKQILKEFDKLNTKDVRTVTKRIQDENSLKKLSKEVGNKKDKADYLRREHMSDAELKRKVTRLQAKDSLHKAVREASKEQREFGEKVYNISKAVSLKFAMKKVTGKPIEAQDLYDIVKKPKEKADGAQKDLQKEIWEKLKQQNRPS